MPDLKITRADLNERNEYVGDASGVDGHIIIEADLGTVLFKGAVRARLSVTAKAGSGIEAGAGIKAGDGIEAGWGIEAGLSITAEWVSAGLRIFAGICSWRLPEPGEDEIRAELRGGTIGFGKHVPPAPGEAA